MKGFRLFWKVCKNVCTHYINLILYLYILSTILKPVHFSKVYGFLNLCLVKYTSMQFHTNFIHFQCTCIIFKGHDLCLYLTQAVCIGGDVKGGRETWNTEWLKKLSFWPVCHISIPIFQILLDIGCASLMYLHMFFHKLYFLQVSVPYFKILEKWIYQGINSDPYADVIPLIFVHLSPLTNLEVCFNVDGFL